ncbi:MAG: tetratricopeptide repeat protein [Deltaproteobacteria bacterium]|nr:tetratricopeptide repeat protein [Deltaproteobacteria bacterium]
MWLSPHARTLYDLASAYSQSGDLESAKKQYENILDLTTGRLLYGDLYAKSLYALGKIHEELGSKAKAIENYEKFLNLWKDADPGHSEVGDAKERMAGLK